MTLDDYFAGRPDSRQLFDAVHSALHTIGAADVRATKSQVAFRRRRAFAWVWIPGRYLLGERPPLVLTIGLRRRDASSRWKQVVEPAPGRFTHHLELRDPDEVDAEVRAWLREAWDCAG